MATIWDDKGRIVMKIQSEKITSFIIKSCNVSHQNGAYRFNTEEGVSNRSVTAYFEFYFYPGYIMVL